MSPLNSLEIFYTDIKNIELVKKQTMFQKKMKDFKVNNQKTKNVYASNLNLCRLKGRAYHATLLRSESFIYHTFLVKHSKQLFSLKHFFRTTPRTIKVKKESP